MRQQRKKYFKQKFYYSAMFADLINISHSGHSVNYVFSLKDTD